MIVQKFAASHVRRVRVPSQASDVDQFLDDLFNPVLDQLSDARSLSASIKGTSAIDTKLEDDFEEFLSRPDLVAKSIKGGGRGVGGVGSHQVRQFSPLICYSVEC